MKKIILSMLGIITLSTPTLTIVACNNDTLLEITNNDIYDEPNSTGKIDKIAFFFIYALPKPNKAGYPIEYFRTHWDWNLGNKMKIVGYNNAGSLGYPTEYWKVTLQKTQNKGIYVSEYQKSDKPIKNAQI